MSFKVVMSALILVIGSVPVLAMTTVPFKATLSLTLVAPDPSSCDPNAGLCFALTGSGDKMEASHLGKVSYSGTGQFTDNTLSHDVLTEVLTAANGDTITILCNQTVTPIDPSAGLFQGSDVGTVINGTGRFAGATGNCIGQTTIDLVTGAVVKTYTGTISY